MKIFGKRSFEAAKYPKGSPERQILNKNPKTSEYYTSEKWYVEEDHFMNNGEIHPNQPKIYKTFKSRKTAIEYLIR